MKLKELRLNQGLSQKDLAEKLNVSPTNIYNYETGRTEPSIEWIIKLADALNTSVDYLIGHDDVESVQRASASGLSPEELELLRNYALLSDVERRAVQNVINGFIGNASAAATKRA